ncbi:MAG: Stp1/IreP family PP2C-type Ser/Thr phosphatase [Acidimicrobiia bacterium]
MRFNWVVRTDVGRMRDHNEDSVWPVEDGTSTETIVVGVADGMGGHAGGEIASFTALETAVTVGGDPAVRIQAANLAVLDAAKERPRLSGMGTTLTLAAFDPDGDLGVAHVGDSRAYLLRAGDLQQITTDHSYVGEMIATGRLSPIEAETHPYRSVLTRAVGLDPTVEVDSYAAVLKDGDRVLLCSDGLTTMLRDDAITEILMGGDDPGEIADALVAAANDAGGADNITVVVVDVTE